MNSEKDLDFAKRLQRIARCEHAGHAPPANLGRDAIDIAVAIAAKL